MILGLICWVAGFALFAAAATATGWSTLTMMAMAVILHGFSYDFVFVAGYLYVDRHAREDVWAQAQGLLVVFTQGIGFLLSSQIFVGLVFGRIVGKSGGPQQWQLYWLAPAGFMAVILVLFWFLFRDDARSTSAPGDDDKPT